MPIESVMPSNHLILCRPLLLLLSIISSIRVFSNESVLRIRWPKFQLQPSVLPMNIQDWFPLGWTGWISLLSKVLSRIFSNTTAESLLQIEPASCFVTATRETRRWSWAFTELEWARNCHDLRIYYTDVLIKTLIILGPFRISWKVRRTALGFPDFPGPKSLRVLAPECILKIINKV